MFSATFMYRTAGARVREHVEGAANMVKRWKEITLDVEAARARGCKRAMGPKVLEVTPKSAGC